MIPGKVSIRILETLYGLSDVDISELLNQVCRRADSDRRVSGAALVGSHANGTATLQSDIDLVILSDAAAELLQSTVWPTIFGVVRDSRQEDYGALTSLRVFYENGLEVEFGITKPSWASVPLDAGTREVIQQGIHILYDPYNIFVEAINEIVF